MTESGLLATELVAELQTYSRREDDQVVEEVGMLSHEGTRLMYLLVRPLGTSRRTGLVLCHSLFEFKMLQSAEIALARAAAQTGFPSMYIEAPGMGDSEGAMEECTVDARAETAHVAAAELRSKAREIEGICMFGARMGAAVACIAAQRLDPRTALALWDPAFTAEDYWKQSKRFARVVAALGRQGKFVDPDQQLAEKGSASLVGYTVTKQIVDDLGRIDMVSQGPHLEGPALVVSLNDQMVSNAVATVSKFVGDVQGISLGRPKPRHLIHMGLREAADAVGATVTWMEEKLP